ncbi:MAG: uncharacterized protein QOF24_2084 [Verrucomicrobiota bacterium]|jgi:uncharacterized protein YbaP (TraB family)
MAPKLRSPLAFLLFFAALVVGGARAEATSGCIWKITGPTGGTLYLGGSIHALRSTDYPLPSGYNRAFDTSTRVALEVDPKALETSSSGLLKAGKYPKGDNLKNHVDPRTYDYLRRLFGLLKIPEEKFSLYRPWCLVLLLESPSSGGFSHDLGVDEFVMNRARANGKAIVGLESSDEHSAVYSGLSERQSEALLLVSLIPTGNTGGGRDQVLNAWRRGDVESLSRSLHAAYVDFPLFADRMLGARNRRWVPKLEGYLRSGQTYFVVVGAAHLGGGDGLLALLRARNCKVEQL